MMMIVTTMRVIVIMMLMKKSIPTLHLTEKLLERTLVPIFFVLGPYRKILASK